MRDTPNCRISAQADTAVGGTLEDRCSDSSNTNRAATERARMPIRLRVAESALRLFGGRETASPGRSDGSACHFAGGAEHPLSLELGERLLVLLVVPVDVAALVDGSRRAEQLVQALFEQCVLGAFLLGERTSRRAGRGHPSRARLAPAAVLGGGHGFPVRGSPRSR